VGATGHFALYIETDAKVLHQFRYIRQSRDWGEGRKELQFEVFRPIPFIYAPGVVAMCAIERGRRVPPLLSTVWWWEVGGGEGKVRDQCCLNPEVAFAPNFLLARFTRDARPLRHVQRHFPQTRQQWW
jgi:hypothetical protein